MNNTEVLIIHGAPGSGKSTIADAVAEILREANTPHAVIDPDEISRIFPTQDPSFSKKNQQPRDESRGMYGMAMTVTATA